MQFWDLAPSFNNLCSLIQQGAQEKYQAAQKSDLGWFNVYGAHRTGESGWHLKWPPSVAEKIDPVTTEDG